MKQAKIFMLLALTFMLALAGCSGSGAGGGGAQPEGDGTVKENPKGAGQSEKVTITVQYPPPDQEVDRKAMDDKIARFQQQYPQVVIEKSDWFYSDGGAATLGLKLAAGEAPSYYNTYATEAKILTDKGYAADITSLLNGYEYKDQINQSLLDIFHVDGKYYAIPQGGYVMSVGLNAKLFRDNGAELPPYDWTWEEMIEAAKSVNAPDKGIAGFAVAGQSNAAGWNLTNFMYQAGDFVEEVKDGKVTATFNSEAGLKVLELYRDLRWKYNVLPGDWNLANPDLSNLYKQGRLGIIFHSGSLNTGINDGGFAPEDAKIYPLPSMEKGSPNYAITGGNFFVINPQQSPEQQEMAFKFITYDYFQDSGIETEELKIQERQKNKQMHIPELMPYYNLDSEYAKRMNEMYAKYPGVVYEYDPEFMKIYSSNAMPEPPFDAQEYYAIMTNIIQEIFSNKNADLRQLLKDGAEKMQAAYLDKIEL
ncbi:ABC transporter substrate-binding protein [Paenibacillus faecis]|uniref:ABC transporter substrate-binding protein n=1 Tax=Paenibacillus faecis TaxID=862114 RepID=A0A5D0CLD5_9BACL|nr:ABC transporter substrate-binding protein [Paenibacillus faecis]TYA09974.1 ABC transporter substrate-binding protein [Paenibacillus faecis]